MTDSYKVKLAKAKAHALGGALHRQRFGARKWRWIWHWPPYSSPSAGQYFTSANRALTSMIQFIEWKREKDASTR